MSDLPLPILDLVARVHAVPVAKLGQELGRFVLVGEAEEGDADAWSFSTTSLLSPVLAEQVALGFNFDRGIVHPIRKQSTTFPETVLIGRSRSNDIRVDHASVSKLHARIRLEEDGFEIEDAGSRNGTWHEETRIERPVKVFPGDTLRFGSRGFIVHSTPRLLDLLERVDPD